MKTIEEATHEYGDSYAEKLAPHMTVGNTGLYKAFEAGVEFAQQWIPIEEEFPDLGTWIILKNDNTYAAARLHGDVDVKFIKMNFTHWRPIELK
jgi:hypothetical protein